MTAAVGRQLEHAEPFAAPRPTMGSQLDGDALSFERRQDLASIEDRHFKRGRGVADCDKGLARESVGAASTRRRPHEK